MQEMRLVMIAVHSLWVLLQVLVSILQGYKVLPNNTVGLGGGRSAGVPTRLQHAQPSHPSQEPQLSSSGLQFQSQACEGKKHI